MAPGRPRSRAIRIGAALAAVGVVGTTVGALAGSGGVDDDRTTTTTIELSGTAKELADLLEQRESATYHAKYEGSGPADAALVIETWQERPNARQDQIITSGGDQLQLSTFVIKGSRFTCLRVSTEPWSCRPGTTNDQATADPLNAIRERIGEGAVEAEDARVEGRSARCYTFEVDDERNELCVLPSSGIPVRIRGGSSELRLVSLEEAVDPAVFELPAEVGDPTAQ